MVKPATLKRFVNLGGYDIMHKKGGTWRGYPEAEKKTGMTRMTIYRLLQDHPEPPPKVEAKYVKVFEESEGWKRFKMKYSRKTAFKMHKSILMKASRYLVKVTGKKKDPMSWTKKDYELIWYAQDSPFIYEWLEGGKVPKGYAVAFRNMMRVTDQTGLLAEFKGTRLPTGQWKGWFLSAKDIIGMLSKFEENETLIMLGLGITKGARFSCVVLGKPEQVNWEDGEMNDYESKIDKHIWRKMPICMLNLLKRYIDDYKIEPQQLLFTHSYTWYMEQLQKAAKRAGINKRMGTHIMKHTFVTQASRHGVSAEIIVEQVHTQLRVLDEFYKDKNPEKARFELQDIKYPVISWTKWIEGLMPYFIENYERIKLEGSKVDGIRSKL